MKKIIVLATFILASCAALAQNFSFTNNNPSNGSSINATIYCSDGKYAMTGNISPLGSASLNSAAFQNCPSHTNLAIYLGTTGNTKQFLCDTKTYDPNATYTLWYDISGGNGYPYQCKLRS